MQEKEKEKAKKNKILLIIIFISFLKKLFFKILYNKLWIKLIK